MTQSPLRGSYNFHNVTQGSLSLALGLALVATPQLVLPSILLPEMRDVILITNATRIRTPNGEPKEATTANSNGQSAHRKGQWRAYSSLLCSFWCFL